MAPAHGVFGDEVLDGDRAAVGEELDDAADVDGLVLDAVLLFKIR